MTEQPASNVSAITSDVKPGLLKAAPGESPLDFIQKNLAKAKAQSAVQPKENISTPPSETKVEASTETPAQAPKEEVPVLTQSGEVSFIPEPIKIETKQKQAETKPQETPQNPAEPDFESEADIPPLEKNYKLLRSKYKETSKSLKEIAAEKEALKEKIEKYDKGEEAPEYVVSLKKRLQELEPLEHIHRLKTSDAYKTTIIEPLNEKLSTLKSLAKDYEIDESVIEEASNITNTRELNQFLLNHFDEVGALEAKQQITAIQKLRDQAQKAESTPKEALSKLEEQHAAIVQGRESQRRNAIAETGRFAWRKAITKIIEEGRVAELIPRENDPEFNEKYPIAIQEQAAKDYGRLVRELADGGLKELKPELGEALATAALLSIASAVSVERANAAERYAAEMEKTSERNNKYFRPNLGAQGGGTASSNTAYVPKSTVEASRELLNTVLHKK